MVVLFLFGFSVAFMMVMKGDPDQAFISIPYSLLTTAAMMSGDIDYRDVFLDDNLSANGFGFLQKVFLVIFIITLVIALMNLLVGLAVDDISGIIKRSQAENQLNKVFDYNK